MKTVSKRVGELKRDDIIRKPIGRYRYNRVKGFKFSIEGAVDGVAVTILVDGGREIASDINDVFYVLEDEPAPIVLDEMRIA